MTIKESLHEYFVVCLRGLLNGEKTLKTELNKIKKSAYSEEVKDLIDLFYKNSEQEEKALIKVFDILESKEAEKKADSKIIRSIIKGSQDAKNLTARVFKTESAPLDKLISVMETTSKHFKGTEVVDYVISNSLTVVALTQVVEYKIAIDLANLFELKEIQSYLKNSLNQKETMAQKLEATNVLEILTLSPRV